MTYGYDWGSRLTSETRTGTNPYSITYTVDPVGNRTGETVGGTSTNPTRDNDDELTATSGGFSNSYSYNANGEQTGRTLAGTANTLAFDYDGQLKSITQGTNVTSFSYDALGRRMSRTPAGGSTTDTQFMGSAPLTESVGGSYTAAYTYGKDQLRRNGEYAQFDGAGSARGETNWSQGVTYTQNTDSFGNQAGSSGSTSSSAKFAGDWRYQTDGDAGRVHACPERSRGTGARHYDPQVGSFATRDTMLDQIPYAYCGHDPVNWADPSGHWPKWDGYACDFIGLLGGPFTLVPPVYGGIEAIDEIRDGYKARHKFHKMRNTPGDTWIHTRPDDGHRRVDPGWHGGLPAWSQDPTPWLD